jgi:hypothetical protein
MMFHSTSTIPFLLCFFLHPIGLQVVLVVLVSFESQCDSCSSPCYYSSWKNIVTNLNPHNICFAQI